MSTIINALNRNAGVENFLGDGNILYFDLYSGNMRLCICKFSPSYYDLYILLYIAIFEILIRVF